MRLFFLTVVAAAFVFSGFGDIVFENHSLRLVLGEDAQAKSLVVKATGEEMLSSSERVPFFTVTQARPFNNELKLAYSNKRTTFHANRLRREGDRLLVGFELVPYEAEVGVEVAGSFVAFTLNRFVVDRKAHYGSLKMDLPPAKEFRVVQLAVKERANFGAWLNTMHDERAGPQGVYVRAQRQACRRLLAYVWARPLRPC